MRGKKESKSEGKEWKGGGDKEKEKRKKYFVSIEDTLLNFFHPNWSHFFACHFVMLFNNFFDGNTIQITKIVQLEERKKEEKKKGDVFFRKGEKRRRGKEGNHHHDTVTLDSSLHNHTTGNICGGI